MALSNDATGQVRNTASDTSGAFVMAGLPPGIYTLKVKAEGFRSLEQRSLLLNTGRTTDLNIRLEVESVRTDVEVVDSAAKIAVSTEARISDSFTRQEMSSLPLYRDIYALPKLSAGATSIPGAASSTKLNSSQRRVAAGSPGADYFMRRALSSTIHKS